MNYIVANSGANAETVVREAITILEEELCLEFVEVTENETSPHIIFMNPSVNLCYSSVGMIYWRNGQNVALGPGCIVRAKLTMRVAIVRKTDQTKAFNNFSI